MTCAQGWELWTSLEGTAELRPYRAMIRSLHLRHNVHANKGRLDQTAVGKDVVNTRAIVGLPGTSKRGPAREGVGALWVEMTEGVNKLATRGRFLGDFFKFNFSVLFCCSKKEMIQPLPPRIIFTVILNETVIRADMCKYVCNLCDKTINIPFHVNFSFCAIRSQDICLVT